MAFPSLRPFPNIYIYQFRQKKHPPPLSVTRSGPIHSSMSTGVEHAIACAYDALHDAGYERSDAALARRELLSHVILRAWTQDESASCQTAGVKRQLTPDSKTATKRLARPRAASKPSECTEMLLYANSGLRPREEVTLTNDPSAPACCRICLRERTSLTNNEPCLVNAAGQAVQGLQSPAHCPPATA